jgi:hypothetical protein
MARSRNYQKSRHCLDEVRDRLRRLAKLSRSIALDEGGADVVRGGELSAMRRSQLLNIPFDQKRRLSIERDKEMGTAHVSLSYR